MATLTSRFRTSFTSRQGMGEARVVQCKVMNINMKNWTVDVISQFDRHHYYDIQVGAPYLHYNQGEGVYIFPEIGAKCMVCLPSDSSPPFVMSFIAPMEVQDIADVVTAEDTTVTGTSTKSSGSKEDSPSDASFSAGRFAPKPGDITLKTRDGNFVILHRGGVLQIGATEAAQRIFIPLGNLVTDIAERYAMHTAGGSISWGLQEAPSKEKMPAQFQQVLRVYANEKAADIRISKGYVYNPTGEPSGSTDTSQIKELGIGEGADNPLCYEIVVAKNGFEENGDTINASVKDAVSLRYVFDRTGGVFFRAEGNVLLSLKKKLRLLVKDAALLKAKSLLVQTDQDVEISSGTQTNISSPIVLLGKGAKSPVARAGDPVQLVGVFPVTGTVGGSPFVGTITISPATPVTGIILSGNPNVKA